MSGHIGQIGRKKDQKSAALLKSKNFFFKYQMQKKIQRRETNKQGQFNKYVHQKRMN